MKRYVPTVARDDEARGLVLAGVAVCAKLLVRGRSDLIVRLASDLLFAADASAMVLEAFRAPGLRDLGRLVEQIEALASRMDGFS